MVRITQAAVVVFLLVSAGRGQEAKAQERRADPPALKPAFEARERIETAGRSLDQLEADLIAAMKRMMPGKMSATQEKQTVEALRAYVRTLREVGKEVAGRGEEFLRISKAYRDAVAAAPAAFREASKVFAQYAEEETFKEFKEDYQKLSRDWLTIAVMMEQRGKAMEQEDRDRDWQGTMRFLQRSCLFLDRLDTHLEAWPVNLEEGVRREQYLNDLKRYLDGFESLRKQLGTFREKLEKSARSPEVRKRYVEELARREAETKAEKTYRTAVAPPPLPPPLLEPRTGKEGRYYISRVEGDLAVLEAGSVQGLRSGQALKVWRSGTPIANIRVTATVRQDLCDVEVYVGTVRVGDYVELQTASAATDLVSRR